MCFDLRVDPSESLDFFLLVFFGMSGSFLGESRPDSDPASEGSCSRETLPDEPFEAWREWRGFSDFALAGSSRLDSMSEGRWLGSRKSLPGEPFEARRAWRRFSNFALVGDSAPVDDDEGWWDGFGTSGRSRDGEPW